ncbi:GNAT family N-acetyltransferase [Microvirga lenta]|uniref:GNAT family N-acetyltransferase n=1 Tax=Microvirga lenta TaxID=2881337 RepID=UPI001CFDC4CC|nr:GNAT family N-acetyltransferase [Microvirga lenta]MCB5173883.1 GNAT family N-acetyltransferase [Microvirga lenta]
MLPVIARAHPLLGTRRPVLHTLYDDLTPSGDVLLAPDRAEAALQSLFSELRNLIPGHLGLTLSGVRQGSPVLRALQHGADGYVRYRGTRSSYSYLNVQGDYGQYFAGLGNMRRNLKRFRKKLEGHGSVLVELRKGYPAASELLGEFIELEASGWKGRNGTAMADNPGAVAFYKALAENLGSDEEFEWYVIRVNNRVVAAQMCIRCGEALMLAKIAFDETYADCRPGHLLTGEVLRDVFSRQDVAEVNHLSNADWEGFWRMSHDEYVDVHLVRKSAMSTLFQMPRAAVHFAYQSYVRPRIPQRIKRIYRAFKRRGDRKPLRSATSRSVRQDEKR